MLEQKRQSLQQLHGELEQVDHEHAHSLREQIAAYIDRLEDEGEEFNENLRERLVEAEVALQDEHPGLVASLRRAIQIMSNAGL